MKGRLADHDFLSLADVDVGVDTRGLISNPALFVSLRCRGSHAEFQAIDLDHSRRSARDHGGSVTKIVGRLRVSGNYAARIPSLSVAGAEDERFQSLVSLVLKQSVQLFRGG